MCYWFVDGVSFAFGDLAIKKTGSMDVAETMLFVRKSNDQFQMFLC